MKKIISIIICIIMILTMAACATNTNHKEQMASYDVVFFSYVVYRTTGDKLQTDDGIVYAVDDVIPTGILLYTQIVAHQYFHDIMVDVIKCYTEDGVVYLYSDSATYCIVGFMDKDIQYWFV